MTLDATVGGANSNSYLTEAEADTYFGNRLHSSAWTAFADKEAALITASRTLDQYVKYPGWKTTEEQSMDWPREGVVDKDGYAVDDDIIPVEIKDAACELALSMLSEDTTVVDDMAGIKVLKIASLHIEADKRDRADVITDSVWAVLGEYGLKQMKGVVNLHR